MAGRPTGLEPPRPDTWLDASHAAVERLLFKPVIQFDRFFSDERELDAYRARSFVRIRTELEVLQNTRPAPGISLYANLQFPGMGQWMDQLHLVVSGDTTETGNPLFPEEGGTLKTNEVKAVNAELRLSAWESLLARIDVGTGVLFTLPPGVFVRARYRAAVPITELFLTRFATQAYWQSDTGPGTRMDIALERPIEETTLVRLSGHGDVNQRATRGVEYASELAFLHALGPRRAIALAGTMEGASGAPAGVDKYRAYLRYRQDLFRRWIFVEVEPEVVWPWALQQPYRTTYGATFRFELQFQGIEPP